MSGQETEVNLKKVTQKCRAENGTVYRKEIYLPNLLNYGIASLLNQSVLNEYDLPIHHCNPDVFPDYIALNT